MEELKALHRKQLHDLTALITQKKKSATKKTRRGVNDECERLERELKDKQRLELEELDGKEAPETGAADDEPVGETAEQEGDGKDAAAAAAEEDLTSSASKISLGNGVATEPQDEDGDGGGGGCGKGKKPNRAKARLARRAAQMEESIAQARAEADAMPDERAVERKRMEELFEEHSLKETQIAPDGHCLYSAFAHGLKIVGLELDAPPSPDAATTAAETKKGRDYEKTRKAAGQYIASHGEDFEPYIIAEGSTLDDYVRQVTSTAEWGGEMELLALAKSYGVAVKVIQAQGKPVTTINEESGANSDDSDSLKEVWLAYYRRGYGLGEHYNALQKV